MCSVLNPAIGDCNRPADSRIEGYGAIPPRHDVCYVGLLDAL
jgi:hypothetical protein